ncbi:hypothetical protein Plo01_78930 [Planobispora longispora]|uniref:Uncharacterized protein n=1 Tax=Planobispora longispora TaxID=28887 RepID=A0A8J3RUI8_9ACTN|nr:hypothetical protein GCM10020093_119170 [Planobispora longispora]GIH81464.1 hypothetical protein Plo01_78930 [Planobispora longispora]
MTASLLWPHPDSRIAWARVTDAGTLVARWLRRAASPACRRNAAATAEEADPAARDVVEGADPAPVTACAVPPSGPATAGGQEEIAAPMMIREVSARRGVSTGTG